MAGDWVTRPKSDTQALTSITLQYRHGWLLEPLNQVRRPTDRLFIDIGKSVLIDSPVLEPKLIYSQTVFCQFAAPLPE